MQRRVVDVSREDDIVLETEVADLFTKLAQQPTCSAGQHERKDLAPFRLERCIRLQQGAVVLARFEGTDAEPEFSRL